MMRLISLALFLGMLVAPNWSAKVQVNYFSELKTLSDILRLVQERYVDEEPAEDRAKLIEGGIEGILKKLDDPFTRYMPAEVHSSMQEETQGEFGGLGIILGVRDEILTVISPMEGTPAFKKGVRSGDQIWKINGNTTENMDVEAAVKILRGKPGTSVTISIKREKVDKLIDYEITRDNIKVQSVKAGRISTGIAYARITSFSTTTGQDLDKAIDEIAAIEPIEGFILDLRGNPGGLLSAAVEVSQDFLGNGKTIVSIRGRTEEETVFTSRSEKKRDWPLIVLINNGSASASEIVAGAIKDNKRGILMGTKSFGKGSVQTVLPLQNGAALALTTAYYYTPAGIKIHKIGIEPDIEVPFPDLNEEELQQYRDDMERIANEGFEETRKKQEEYLETHSEKAGENTTEVQKTEDEESTNSSLTIPSLDAQLHRAVDVLKALLIMEKRGS